MQLFSLQTHAFTGELRPVAKTAAPCCDSEPTAHGTVKLPHESVIIVLMAMAVKYALIRHNCHMGPQQPHRSWP